MRRTIEQTAQENVEFALFSLQLFEDVVLGNEDYVDLILSDAFTEPTYYMGTVDANNRPNFYDGMIRVVDPDGAEFVKYDAQGLCAAHRRTRRAVDLSQVPLSEGGGLEGVRGRQGQRPLLRNARSRG